MDLMFKLGNLLTILLLFQLKHFLCDYPWQTSYMLFKGQRAFWLGPLIAHSGVHAIMTFAIAFAFTYDLKFSVYCSAFDFFTHAFMDRIKASPEKLGRYQIKTGKDWKEASVQEVRWSRYGWWALGFDQMWHHTVHILISFAIILKGVLF